MSTQGLNFVIKGHNAATPAMNQMRQQLAGIKQQMVAVAPVSQSWNRGLNESRRMFQMLGFQMSDFAVQVAGGQSAMLAFTQQGGQMLQFFGPVGALAAAALSIFGALSLGIVKSGVAASQITPIFGILESQLGVIVSSVKFLGNVLADFINIIINNLDVAVILASLALGRWVAGMVLAKFAASDLAFMISVVGVRAGLMGAAINLVNAALVALRSILMTVLPIALIVGITYLIVQFFALVKAVGSVGEAFVILGELATSVFEDIVGASATMAVGIGNEIGGISPRVKDVMNNVIGQFVGTFRATVAIFSNLPDAFRRFGALAVNGLLEMIQGGLSKMADLINPILTKFGKEPIAVDLSSFTVAVPAAVDVMGSAASAFGEAMKTDYVGSVVESTKQASDEFVKHGSKTAEVWAKMQGLMGKGYDVRDWFKGSKDKGKGGGGGGGAAKLKKEVDEAKKIFDDLSKTISGAMLSGFKEVLKGTKSLKDAALDMLDKVLDKVVDILMTPIFESFSGGITGGILRMFGMKSFSGGGYTGSGSRTGGVDGKGGFMAIMHPNETVIDHTMQGAKSGAAGGVVHLEIVEAPGFAARVRSEAYGVAVSVSSQSARMQRAALPDTLDTLDARGGL